MAFVLDNSVVSGWLIGSQATAYSAAISDRLQEEQAVAPSLLVLEYTNVLRTACMRRALDAGQAHQAVLILRKLPIHVDTDAPDPAIILDLALRHDLTSYDAVYLDLALRLKLPIATQDVALARAATVVGVGIVAG